VKQLYQKSTAYKQLKVMLRNFRMNEDGCFKLGTRSLFSGGFPICYSSKPPVCIGARTCKTTRTVYFYSFWLLYTCL